MTETHSLPIAPATFETPFGALTAAPFDGGCVYVSVPDEGVTFEGAQVTGQVNFSLTGGNIPRMSDGTLIDVSDLDDVDDLPNDAMLRFRQMVIDAFLTRMKADETFAALLRAGCAARALEMADRELQAAYRSAGELLARRESLAVVHQQALEALTRLGD